MDGNIDVIFFQLRFVDVLNYLLKQNVCRKITNYTELGGLVHLKDKEIFRALGSVRFPKNVCIFKYT